MEVGDGETETRGGGEAARGRDHADRGWLERVLRREGEGAPVLAVVVGGVGRAGEEVVPFEDVGF